MKRIFEDLPRRLALLLCFVFCLSGARLAGAQETGGFNFGDPPFSDGLQTPIYNIHSNWPFASNPGGLPTTPPLLASFSASSGDSFDINSLTNPFKNHLGLLGESPSHVSNIRLMMSFNYLVSSVNFDWLVNQAAPSGSPVGTLGVIARTPGASLISSQEAQLVPLIAVDPLNLGQHFTWYLPEPRANFEIFLSREVGGQNYGLFSIAGLQVDATSQLAPIPEPETYAMMLAGFAILGLRAWRRKQKAA